MNRDTPSADRWPVIKSIVLPEKMVEHLTRWKLQRMAEGVETNIKDIRNELHNYITTKLLESSITREELVDAVAETLSSVAFSHFVKIAREEEANLKSPKNN